MTLIEAAKMALEYGSFPPGGGIVREIRQAIEESERQDGPINGGWQITVAHGHSGYGVYAHMEDHPEEGAVLVQAIEQQEPGFYARAAARLSKRVEELEAQGKREWRGLTEEEIKTEWVKVIDPTGGDEVLALARAIEAKLKEKNT